MSDPIEVPETGSPEWWAFTSAHAGTADIEPPDEADVLGWMRMHAGDPWTFTPWSERDEANRPFGPWELFLLGLDLAEEEDVHGYRAKQEALQRMIRFQRSRAFRILMAAFKRYISADADVRCRVAALQIRWRRVKDFARDIRDSQRR